MFAKEFSEIFNVLSSNTELRNSVLHLIETQPIAGKVTEGGDRLPIFREIMISLVLGEIDLPTAYRLTGQNLSRATSIHAENNKVFAERWDERLVRTQLSRFYNQAVLEYLHSRNETECYVPHSSEEDSDTKCSRFLAGTTQETKVLLDLLIDAYGNGNWSKGLKIPDHPHCSHVVAPVSMKTL